MTLNIKSNLTAPTEGAAVLKATVLSPDDIKLISLSLSNDLPRQ
jgi:hypothetical protein